MRRLPNGKLTDSVDEYIDAWHYIAKPFILFTGYKLVAFDPDFVFELDKDRIPVSVKFLELFNSNMQNNLKLLTDVVESTITFGHYEQSEEVAEQIYSLLKRGGGHRFSELLSLLVDEDNQDNRFIIKVSDEGKQCDNYTGIYLVFAHHEEDAKNKVRFLCKDLDDPIITTVDYYKYNKAISSMDVILLDYDSYN